MNHKTNLILALLLVMLPVQASPTPREVPLEDRALLDKALENLKIQENSLSNYTYTRTENIHTRGLFNRKVQHQKVSETYLIRTGDLSITLEVDGKPVSPQEIETQRRRAAALMERAEAQARKATGKQALLEYSNRYKSVTFSPFELSRRMDFHNRRIERLNDRPSIVLDFKPRSPSQSAGPGPAYYDHLCGSLWIDQETRFPVKVRAYLHPLQGGDELVYAEDYAKFADGKWHCSFVRINTSVRPSLFGGENVDWVIKYDNYKAFSVEGARIERIPPETTAAPPMALNN